MGEVGQKPVPKGRAVSVLLKVGGWLWCMVAAIIAVSLLSKGYALSAFAFGLSAFLAVAPRSWNLFAPSGVQVSRKAKLGFVGGAAVGGMIIALIDFAPPATAPTKVADAQGVAMASPEGPSTCDGITAASRDFAVLEGAPLQERADAQSGQVSIPFGVNKDMKPVSIDPTMPVREICRSGKWSFISILQLPSDIGNGKGWVPTDKLRPVETDKSGRRIYEAADFEWPDGSKPYRKSALAVVNRIMAQNPRCDAFGSQALLFDKDRAGALFKVACFGATEQVVDFRPDDATNGRSFAPVDPLDEKTAREACWNAAKERATHPSTVDISTFGGQFYSDDSGGTSYRTTFTAKNSFNLTLNYTILCSFKGSRFADVDIQETAE